MILNWKRLKSDKKGRQAEVAVSVLPKLFLIEYRFNLVDFNNYRRAIRK